MTAKLSIAAMLVAGCEVVTARAVGVTSSPPASPVAYTLTSAGSAWLDVEHGPPIRVDHVRIELDANREITAYAAQATLTATGGAPTFPLAIQSDLETLPIVMLDPGQLAVIDFYFPAADAADHAFAWPLASGGRSIVARGRVEPRADVAFATSEHWWFSPTYAWPELRHQDGVITTKPPTRAEVRSAIENASTRDSIPAELECDEW